MKRRFSTNSLRVLGIGSAACAACCVGPILGFLAAAGVFTVAGVATFGVVGLLALVPLALWWMRRRRHSQTCAAPTESVAVALGRRS